jgi:peptide/nickel transport system substrate-binding protein
VYINKNYDLSFVLHTEAHDFENWANPDYYFTYDNPEVQALYAKSVAATDPDQAADFLKQAAKIVADGPGRGLALQRASVVAVAPTVTGFPTVNTNERMNLADLAKSR